MCYEKLKAIILIILIAWWIVPLAILIIEYPYKIFIYKHLIVFSNERKPHFAWIIKNNFSPAAPKIRDRYIGP